MTSDRTTNGDRRANRIFAVAWAMGGLVVLMVQDAPNWPATAIGLGCLFAFTGLWFLPAFLLAFLFDPPFDGPPEPRPARPRRIRVYIIPAASSEAARPLLLEGPPDRDGAARRPASPVPASPMSAWLVPGKPVSRWSLRRWRALRRA